MVERYYVYAIVTLDMRLPDRVSGFGGPLFVVPYRDLGAVVSQLRAQDVNDALPAPSAENLMRHETVVEAVRAAGLALPVRFGTALPDSEAVMRALARQYDTLRNDMQRIGDKVEMGVTILWRRMDTQPNPMKPDVGTDSTSGATANHTERRPGLEYLRARQVEYQRAESARAQAQTLGRELDAALRPYALQWLRSLCPTERIALRDVYLLERERVGAFEKAFDELRLRHREAPFLLSGPWPPYSFVTPPAQPESEPVQAGR